MNTFFTLKQRIMWRIYTVWAARAALSRTALKTYILVFLLWRTTAYVSFSNVWHNAPALTNVGRNIEFFGSAITRTETSALILLFGGVILGAWVAFDLVPALRRREMMH